MSSRLTINLREGLLQVEGSEEFVRAIYDDFKEEVAKSALKPADTKPLQLLEQPAEASAVEHSARPQKRARRSGGTESGKSKGGDYKPTFKNLDLSGLAEFYDRFSPSSHNEKILCFAIFLRDKLQISPCSADDIYTCYFTLKGRTKTPEAFQQAFFTAKSRTHFIEFEWPHSIEVTIAGDNFFGERLNADTSK